MQLCTLKFVSEDSGSNADDDGEALIYVCVCSFGSKWLRFVRGTRPVLTCRLPSPTPLYKGAHSFESRLKQNELDLVVKKKSQGMWWLPKCSVFVASVWLLIDLC